MRIALVTNMPAPYRIHAWNKVSELQGDDFLVIFCCHREPNRNWDIPEIKFRHIFLKENYYAKKDGTSFVHNNRDVWKHLKSFNPDIVITSGFNPTMLYAFAYCLIKRKNHIPISDAWIMSERNLSFIHRLLRKVIFRFSHAFIACSDKGKKYYQSYGLKEKSIFISHYTITGSLFSNTNSFKDRPYDLLYAGQFIERKNPFFFIDVAKLVKKKGINVKLLLLGDGPLKNKILAALEEANIEYTYPGHARQQELPGYYGHSRLFLFPTRYDAWGVVANESLAAGTPVLSTPYAGCTDELILHNQNGFILEPDTIVWADQCAAILRDEQKWNELSVKASEAASHFTHARAGAALLDACNYALNQ